MRRPALLLLALTLAVSACGRRGGGSGDDDDNGGSGLDLVTDLAVVGVSINQATEVTLVQDGQSVPALNAGVVANRRARVHVFAERDADFEPREIVASLEFEGGGFYEDFMTVNTDSSIDSQGTLFKFDVDAEDIVPGAGFRVELREAEAGVSASGDADDATWPRDDGDFEIIDAREAGGPLKIVLIPVQYDGDGSGRLPDTSDSQVEVIRQTFMKLYPVDEVQVTVGAPFPYPYTVSAINPNDWSYLLDSIMNLRDQRGAAFDEYYYGLFNGANSIYEFCGGGCIAGLSSVPFNPTDSWARASIGVGFTGEDTAWTMVHEVGHAHGRLHAPCNTSGDNQYPYSNARLGVWGWDMDRGDYKSPGAHADFMSYCEPNWISDYTFDALFDWTRAVNQAADWRFADARDMTSLVLGGDGQARWGERLQRRGIPGGAAVPVDFLDEQGAVIQRNEARGWTFSHADGVRLLVPDWPDGAVALRHPAGTTPLP